MRVRRVGDVLFGVACPQSQGGRVLAPIGGSRRSLAVIRSQRSLVNQNPAKSAVKSHPSNCRISRKEARI